MSSTNLGLTERGALQAEAAHKYLQGVKFDYVFSSPLLRARQTAEIICGDKDVVQVCDDLKEMLFGELEGLTWEEKSRRYPTIDTGKYLSKTKIPEGESFDDLVLRCDRFIKDKLSQIKVDANVLIASHAITKRVLINCMLEKLSHYVDYINFADNTAITEICLVDKKLVRLNDRTHLIDATLASDTYELWSSFSEKDYTQL